MITSKWSEICRKVIAAVVTRKHSIEIWGDGTQTRSFIYIDDCLKGIQVIALSNVLEPINLGSSELVSINQLMDMAQDIAGIRLNRWYKLDAPRGFAGRNSDNAKIREYLGWEPDTRLHDGMEKTYRLIYDEVTAKYNAKTARTQLASPFSHGSRPIPGDGFDAKSGDIDTWRQGIPATFGRAKAKARAKSWTHAKSSGKRTVKRSTKNGYPRVAAHR